MLEVIFKRFVEPRSKLNEYIGDTVIEDNTGVFVVVDDITSKESSQRKREYLI